MFASSNLKDQLGKAVKTLVNMRREANPRCASCGRLKNDSIHSSTGPRGSTWHPFRTKIS